MMYMNMHKIISHHPLKKKSCKNVRNSILTKIWQPTDDLSDCITSQQHSEDHFDQVLKTYKAYQETQSETETPNRQMNADIACHVAQANQAKHGSLADRGVNGGLAGSDVRVLSTLSRKCTVTGIDNHEIAGLELVQCAALVQTNHMVWLIS